MVELRDTVFADYCHNSTMSTYIESDFSDSFHSTHKTHSKTFLPKHVSAYYLNT